MDDWISKRGEAVLSPQQLKAFSLRSDRQGAIYLGGQLAVLAFNTVLLALSWGHWWAIFPFISQGILLNCLYAAQHETSHRTAFRSRFLNVWIGQIIGFIEIYPARWDRYFHFAHHRHTQDWAKDPELLIRTPYTRGSWLLNMTGFSYWAGRINSTVESAFSILPDYIYWLSNSQRREVIMEARLHLAGYGLIFLASVFFHSWAVVIFWLAPMLLLKCVHQLQNVGEHTGLTHEPDTLRNTRTLMGPGPVRWLIWNMTYHAAHHTYPSVPFHALPALQKEISSQLGHRLPETGYLRAQLEIHQALAPLPSGAQPSPV
jgi:fatty acid desaturase